MLIIVIILNQSVPSLVDTIFVLSPKVSQYLPWIADSFDLLPPDGFRRWKPKRRTSKNKNGGKRKKKTNRKE